ncbi:Ty3/gypsy retrotransposon protein [Quillaja saponaria]|uniref:Ty3/gypsy retrotransposon protein n=1 Tax=Quillaja saponaria TaxID=32244 RepID=A0AAD7L1H4_QUISA|nr:Ty3/gypsy retrotransposon protein [Quillaja saponaria]
MTDWPAPTNVKAFRGFLGLNGYYRKIVMHYAHIAAPLTCLLKENSFDWTSQVEVAFQALKSAMVHTLVLALPDFSKTFEVETDASLTCIGAILSQVGHPLAFFSKKLSYKMPKASTYSRELFAIVQVVHKWRQYLLGRRFLILTNHRS